MSNSSYVELVGSAPTPVFTIPKNCLPRNSIFNKLRSEWKKAAPGRRSKDLAELLSVKQQAISQWCTGSDNREPPWWAIMRLCHETDHYLEIFPHCVRIQKIKKAEGVVR